MGGRTAYSPATRAITLGETDSHSKAFAWESFSNCLINSKLLAMKNLQNLSRRITSFRARNQFLP